MCGMPGELLCFAGIPFAYPTVPGSALFFFLALIIGAGFHLWAHSMVIEDGKAILMHFVFVAMYLCALVFAALAVSDGCGRRVCNYAAVEGLFIAAPWAWFMAAIFILYGTWMIVRYGPMTRRYYWF